MENLCPCKPLAVDFGPVEIHPNYTVPLPYLYPPHTVHVASHKNHKLKWG